MITPETVPAVVIAFAFAYAAGIWSQCRARGLIVPLAYYRIFALAFIAQSLMYFLFHFVAVDLAVRGFWVRVSLMDIALCFSIPLTILYQHSRK